jgi:Na+/proline symporter
MIPGVVGLFLGSLLCASLSSISSFLNSLALIIWEDFLISFTYFQKFSDDKQLNTNKLLVCFCGLLSTGLCFLISKSDINLAQLNNTLNGTFNAPLLGLFIMSLFFSVTNRYGAIGGTLIALAINCWVSMGALLINPSYEQLSVSVQNCSKSYDVTTITFQNATKFEGFDKLYSLSYMWYTAFGAIIAIVSGLIISLATGGNKNKADTDKSLIIADLFGIFKRKKLI